MKTEKGLCARALTAKILKTFFVLKTRQYYNFIYGSCLFIKCQERAFFSAVSRYRKRLQVISFLVEIRMKTTSKSSRFTIVRKLCKCHLLFGLRDKEWQNIQTAKNEFSLRVSAVWAQSFLFTPVFSGLYGISFAATKRDQSARRRKLVWVFLPLAQSQRQVYLDETCACSFHLRNFHILFIILSINKCILFDQRVVIWGDITYWLYV